jgi:16S rRNA A1518/A1519 N6-dimethyltransferase RsmA/KsgA/DIM1 with predicted DNA glycosylase/AP lyase activity
VIIPDKHSYKPTITQALRNEIVGFACGTFLEIGCDIAYTTESFIPYFDKLVAIDIDPKRIKTAQTRVQDEKVQFIVGTCLDIPINSYDVVLIDAAHDYKNVMNDFQNVYEKNSANKFVVVFHDYGLSVSGVKKAVEQISQDYDCSFSLCGEKEKWNPHGGSTFDYEAAKIEIIK